MAVDPATQQKIYTSTVNGRPTAQLNSGYDTPYGYKETDYAGLGKTALQMLENSKSSMDMFKTRQDNTSYNVHQKEYNQWGGDATYNALKSGNYTPEMVARIFNMDAGQLSQMSQGQQVASEYATDPTTGNMVKQSALAEQAANKAAVEAGTMKNVGTAEAPLYVPTGSAGDLAIQANPESAQINQPGQALPGQGTPVPIDGTPVATESFSYRPRAEGEDMGAYLKERQAAEMAATGKSDINFGQQTGAEAGTAYTPDTIYDPSQVQNVDGTLQATQQPADGQAVTGGGNTLDEVQASPIPPLPPGYGAGAPDLATWAIEQRQAIYEAYQKYGITPSIDEVNWQLTHEQDVGAIEASIKQAVESGADTRGTNPEAGTSAADIIGSGNTVANNKTDAVLNDIVSDNQDGSNKTLSDMVTQVSAAMGLTDINEQLTAIDDQYADDVMDVNENPWLSEAQRSEQIQLLQGKYETKKNNLIERLATQESALDRAISLYEKQRDYEQELYFKKLDLEESALDRDLDERKLSLEEQKLLTDQWYKENTLALDEYGLMNKESSVKAPSQAQLAALSFYNRANDANKRLEAIESSTNTAALSFQAALKLPNSMQSDEVQQFAQAEREFIEAYLRKDSGAAIADSEYDNARKTLFPQIGDSAATIASKQQARASYMNGLKLQAGTALDQSINTIEDFLNYADAETATKVSKMLSDGYSEEDVLQVLGVGGSNGGADSRVVKPFEKGQYISAIGTITAENGSPYWKPGLDVASKYGTPIPAPTSGKVVAMRKESETGGFGNQVQVLLPDGNTLWISHLKDFGDYSVGQKINKGDVLGTMGNTGNVLKMDGTKPSPGELASGVGTHADITILKAGKEPDYTNKGANGSFFTAPQVKAYLTYNA